MAKTITFNGLSKSSIEQAKKELIKYKQMLELKNQAFTQALATIGLAKAQELVITIGAKPAYETGDLLASLDIKQGDMIKGVNTWYVYTDCPYAPYVEFGTGYVGANSAEHPKAGDFSYQAGGKNNSESGWWYYDRKQDRVRWTAGMPSRPFMYETARDLANQVQTIAKEIFGNA